MKTQNHKALVFIGLLLFALHFSAVIITLSEYQLPLPALNKIVKSYVYPVFYQNWKVFAPEPPLWKEKMFYRYKTGSQWSEWIDPGEPLLEKHYRYRISYYATLFTIYKNIASDLLYQHKQITEEAEVAGLTGAAKSTYVKKQIFDSPAYQTAKKYCTDKTLETASASVDSIQFSYVFIYPPPFSKKESENFEQASIPFPPYKPVL